MNVKCIEIKQEFPGFKNFFGSYLCRDKINLLVDVGPSCSSENLIASLKEAQVDRIDYILLTHIHIDHAGAAADILKNYPMAKVVCHEKAIKFLVDPSKLWEGSLAVLGDYARTIGRPGSIPIEKIIPHTQNPISDLLILETPGHAPHHLSYEFLNHLFAGEAAGNYFRVDNEEYLRPATPPRFFFEVFQASVEKLRALPDLTICYAHYGPAESSHGLLTKFHKQLLLWKQLIYKEFEKGETELVDRCRRILLEKDRNLKAYSRMPGDMQQREWMFLANAINGFIGFFKENS